VIALPTPRGPLSEAVLERLHTAPVRPVLLPPADVADPLGDDDLHLALYLCYELSYRGLPGVDDDWEWEPSLVAMRREMERAFEAGLRRAVAPVAAPPADEIDIALRALIDADDAPSLSRHLEREGTLEQVREFMVHRSAYQLKEADPHSWAIPRLAPGPKAALLEVQFDEYGGGRPERMHSVLFANTMAALGLDSSYGAYLHLLPAPTLATVNLLTGFGLHRRRRGALVGHLAAFEMTSSIPNRRYGNALRRLGYGKDVTDFYDEHVEADAVHEVIAAWDLAGGLARAEPQVAADILFGARALLALEGRWAAHLHGAWEAGETSLRADPAIVGDG
jgi:hypothetical protein